MYMHQGMSYEGINIYNSSMSPSTIHCSNTVLGNFFAKYLLMRLYSVFKFTIPDTWDRKYFLSVLFTSGHLTCLNTRTYGNIVQYGNLYGQNLYYMPTRSRVTNPLLRIERGLLIGKECEIINLQPDYTSAYDIILFFADNMAVTAETILVNTFNSKLSYIFFTDKKSYAETFKSVFDAYSRGEPATVTGNNDLFGPDGKESRYELFNGEIQKNFVVDKLQEALRRWEIMFFSYVGIINNPVNKKERVVTSEVESNNIETRAISDIWLENLQDSFKRVNKLFGIDCSVEYNHDINIGGNKDGRSMGVNPSTI